MVFHTIEDNPHVLPPPNKELRTTILILAKIFNYNLLIVLASGLLFLLFFTWLAYVIFEDTQEGTTEFTSFGTTLYQMFVLFTTSNNLDVWIPAYKESRWYCLFFIYYELLGGYVITNWILAIIYNSFKYQLATQGNEMDCKRKCILKKAFDLIDTENHGFIYKEQCIQLFKELNKYRLLVKPFISDNI
ncbi:hypothetical protein I3843_04G115900 [Carya illinoinensis]|nr:hypothetical protein I3843_04G115900 [Carya illinoinensis]